MRLARPLTRLLVLFVLAAPSAQAGPALCAHVLTGKASADTRAPEGLALLSYYLRKARELNHLDRSAPLAVSLRALILSTSTEVRSEMVALKDLQEIHPITRPTAMDKMDQRIEGLEAMPRWTWRNHELANEVLKAYLPSKNAIRVVRETDGDYVVFDGNGRLFALKQVFPPTLKIEVEHYVSSSPLLQFNLEKLLQTRGLR